MQRPLSRYHLSASTVASCSCYALLPQLASGDLFGWRARQRSVGDFDVTRHHMTGRKLGEMRRKVGRLDHRSRFTDGHDHDVLFGELRRNAEGSTFDDVG